MAEFDPSMFQVTEEERRLARAQAMMAAGLGLLGARKGEEWSRIGQAGLLGMNAYAGNLQDAKKEKLDAFRQNMAVQQFNQGQQEFDMKRRAFDVQQAEIQRKIAEAEAAKKRVEALNSGVAGIFGSGPQLQNMGPGGPTPQNLQRTAPMGQVDRYRAAAALYAQNGDVENAKRLADIADKMEETFSTSPSTGIDASTGKPILSVYGNKGTRRTIEGALPTPELIPVQQGDRTTLVDKLTTAPGTTFAVNQDPNSKASNAVQWARLALDQKREAREASKADAGKWVNDLERGIQVDMVTGDTRPITEQGRPIGQRKDAKLEVGSKRSLSVLDDAERYLNDATGSYIGAGIDTAARAFGGSTRGADAIAQLQALEGALMMNQPRMEGPQSDKDVALYKQMAGKIGDPTVPVSQKKAAITVIRNLHKKYLSDIGVSSGATGGWSIQEVK